MSYYQQKLKWLLPAKPRPRKAKRIQHTLKEHRNDRSVILDTHTGVYFYSIKELSNSAGIDYQVAKRVFNSKSRNPRQQTRSVMARYRLL